MEFDFQKPKPTSQSKFNSKNKLIENFQLNVKKKKKLFTCKQIFSKISIDQSKVLNMEFNFITYLLTVWSWRVPKIETCNNKEPKKKSIRLKAKANGRKIN